MQILHLKWIKTSLKTTFQFPNPPIKCQVIVPSCEELELFLKFIKILSLWQNILTVQ